MKMEITKFEVIDSGYRDPDPDDDNDNSVREYYYLCVVTTYSNDDLWLDIELKNKIRKYLHDKKQIFVNSTVCFPGEDDGCTKECLERLIESESIVKHLHENHEFKIKKIDPSRYGNLACPWVEIIYDRDDFEDFF